jgi:hypothetical protein
MKGKLITDGNGNYSVLDAQNELIGTTMESMFTENKLSIKNRQAIERGYNLDELAIDEFNNSGWTQGFREEMKEDFVEIYTRAFSKALEILGDKKFNHKDILKAIIIASSVSETNYTPNEIVKSIQQTEWDVEIEMEKKWIANSSIYGHGEYELVPKLDADGCLILKIL